MKPLKKPSPLELNKRKDLLTPRHFDISLLSHFPCNFNCKESIKHADKHLEIIRKYDESAAKIIKETLSSAVIYTNEGELYLLKKPELNDNILSHSETSATKDNEIFRLLKDNNGIKIINKNKIIINNKEIDNIGFMLFGSS